MTDVKIELEDLDMKLFVNWGATGCGFGQLRVSASNGQIYCENEYMSRTKIRQLLHALADEIADKTVLADEPLNDTPFTPLPPLMRGKLCIINAIHGLPAHTRVDGVVKGLIAECSHPLVNGGKVFFLSADEVLPIRGW